MAQTESLGLFWTLLGKYVARFLQERAHGEIVLAVQNGTITHVRVNRVYLPANLPDV